jgi:c-di-GMP phosphodiesterase
VGFDYYQGYFFCEPQIVSEQKVLCNRLSTLHILARLQDPEISMDELEHAVGQDLAITYRILRYLNSPVHALPRKIESIRHAIALVGTGLICNWASLILLEQIEDKPRELMITTMVRAHMCQQLGAAMYQPRLDQFFTVGLLSSIDALLDRPMKEALEGLPLIDEVKDAVLDKKGLMGEALDCVQAYERGDWDQTSCGKLDEKSIRDAYLSSVMQTRSVEQELIS